MVRTILLWFITGAVCLAGQSESPEGTWATQIVGRDHGICYLTFSNDLTVVGYGISIDALGRLDVVGGWDYDARGRITGGLVISNDGHSHGEEIHGGVRNDKLRLHAGGVNFKGDPADDFADLSGRWVGEVRSRGNKFFVTFDATLSTNTPAWFDVAGHGTTSDVVDFTLTGALLITPNNRVAAYTVAHTGTSTDTASYVGKLVKKGRRLVLRGRDENHKHVSMHAERP